MTLLGTTGTVTWAVAEAAKPGEAESGDRHFVAPCGSSVILAVVDGLGHGPEAATAARLAVRTLATSVESMRLAALFERCHAELHHTRGVVMTIASITETGTMEWLGVGNVEGLVVHAGSDHNHDSVVARGGVVGQGYLPSLRPSTAQLAPGDLVVLATDGLRSEFAAAIDPARSPDVVAGHLLATCGRRDDDALVLVARHKRCA